nr:hypothetical protein CFP56_50853 [Quercus suber]
MPCRVDMPERRMKAVLSKPAVKYETSWRRKSNWSRERSDRKHDHKDTEKQPCSTISVLLTYPVVLWR